ncbi:acyl-CoA dehydrogenase family protein [Pseudovibrio exalbescens]|uniref:acyl-CoA dehydrogenase family protein n=1 Tax=Pseudovibrio exalbescens TaxID=197461 RepID=UPI0023652295|nr:acyl-CoA dehydrogenase family protein [Pseudovibrio exalbescens]MDD7910703.1 acyl-CoA dehydrogenase family protein [Pseudovibrio exalbescens]
MPKTNSNGAGQPVLNQAPPYFGYNLCESDPLVFSSLGHAPDSDSVRTDLIKMGAQCGAADALDLGRMANVHKPELKTHDAYGRRLDIVEFHPSYHALMRRSFAAGLHCASVDALQPGAKNAHFNRARRYYMMSQVEMGHLCPITMTNAAGMALQHNPEIAEKWQSLIASRTYDQRFRAASQKNSVSLGMGLTEKQGGTDLRQIVTTAERVGEGEYLINGHKWFFSAPMSDAFLVLARTEAGPSCFLVPRVLEGGSVNGLNLIRLKNKMGNLSNASSEVEFEDAHGFLLGEEGQGIKTILSMVNPTRLDCALGSAGVMRGAVARAVHHTRHRQAFGKALFDQPVMNRVLADMALDVAAASALAFRLARAFDAAPENELERDYLRVITPVAKYWVCKTANVVTGEAMECLGGNGYVEEHDLARFYREAPVNSIWEGSGNVMALDLMRVMTKNSSGFLAVLDHLEGRLGQAGKVSVEVLQAAARTCIDDPGSARILTEQLALTAAAAALREAAPSFISDAFMDSRLAGQWRSSYGMLDARHDARSIVDWLYVVA